MEIAPEWLRQPTSYREFTAQWLADEDGTIPARFLARVEQREAVIAAKMSPGDELWSWECGDHAFAMRWGLAVVRAGVVVEAWLEWKS